MRLDPLVFGSATNMLDVLDVAASHTSHLPSGDGLVTAEAEDIDRIVEEAARAAEEKGEEFAMPAMATCAERTAFAPGASRCRSRICSWCKLETSCSTR